VPTANETINYKSQLECHILAVTASSEEQVSKQAIICGIKQVLYKPVQLAILKAAVDKYYLL
jgi:response regulator of citrate/malate metabolism